MLERHPLSITTPSHGLPWQTHADSAGHKAAVWMAAERTRNYYPLIPPRDPVKAMAAEAAAKAKAVAEAEAETKADEHAASKEGNERKRPMKEMSMREKKGWLVHHMPSFT